jgi:hypothetical protein
MKWMTRIAAFFVLIAAIAGMTMPALAAEQDDATAATDEIMSLLASRQFSVIWDQKTSAWMKQQAINRDAFMANLTMGRAQLGSLVSSRFITSEFATQDPGSGTTGRIYANTYLNEYNVGKFYERIVVIKEADGRFRLSGLWGSPAQ